MSLPYFLIFLRAGCAIGIPICAWLLSESDIVIVVLIWIGLISDIFDGIIARRMGIATAKLRQLDSQVDAGFWLAILITATIQHFDGVARYGHWMAALLVLEMTIYLVNFIRFGRAGSTHAWSAKLFGLFLLAGFTELFLTGAAGGWFFAMLIVGTFAQLEGLAIACLLPRWQHDVRSILHVWQSKSGETGTQVKQL